MRKILIILSIVVVNFSCSNNDSDVIPIANCIFTDPTQDLVWLKDRIADIDTDLNGIRKYQYITQSTYLGSPVFIYRNCCPCPAISIVTTVFDCTGELLGIVGTGGNSIHPDLLGDSKVIWFPETFECTLATD